MGTRQILIRVCDDIYEQLKALAKAQDRSVAWIARKAVDTVAMPPSSYGFPPQPIYSNNIPPPSLTPTPINLIGDLVEVKAMKKARATRLPEDFVPDERGREIALSMGLDPQQTLDHFRDYWTSKPGQGGVKLDWQATWRNWCRNTRGPAKAAPRTTGLEGQYDD